MRAVLYGPAQTLEGIDPAAPCLAAILVTKEEAQAALHYGELEERRRRAFA